MLVRDLEYQSAGYLCQQINEKYLASYRVVSLEFTFQEGLYGRLPAFWTDSQVISIIGQGLMAPLTLPDGTLSEFLQLLYQDPSRVVVHQQPSSPSGVANVFASTGVSMLSILRGLTRFISKLA